MGEFFHFRRQEDESGRGRRSDFVHDNPEVAHDFLKGRAERNGVALAQCLDLDSELPSCILAVSDDVDATSVTGGGHDIPPQQREVVAGVVEAGIAGELWIKRHVKRPNAKVQGRCAFCGVPWSALLGAKDCEKVEIDLLSVFFLVRSQSPLGIGLFKQAKMITPLVLRRNVDCEAGRSTLRNGTGTPRRAVRKC